LIAPQEKKVMMTSRFIRLAPTCGLVLALTAMLAGCRGGNSAEQPQGSAANAEKKPEGGAPAEHHDEPTVVALSPEAMERAGIRVEPVRAVTSGQVLIAPAELQPNADRIARVGPRVAGRIARVIVPLGADVRAGQALATIRSPEAAEAAAALDSARAAENLARRSLTRERELFERKVSAQREVLEAEAGLATAEAAVRAAEARLAAMGFSAPSGASQSGAPVVTVTSPIAGTVIERTAAADAPVGPDSVLFTIVDLSSLWLTVRVPETSVAAIRRGQPVSVIVGALPERPVEGRVEYIAPIVTPETRTVDVRVLVPNRGRDLRPGMSASARFDLPDVVATSKSEPRVLLPRAAVQELNQATVVFVPDGDRRFKPQQVTLGSSYGNDVEIVSGVKVGDRIVVQGAFTLKAQAMRGAVADPH
jgi:cobalt-zinc-cadmium efflux system membrane fusion protein